MENAPPDVWYQVYLNIFFQGIGSHFAWNTLLIGQGYFKDRLANVPMARDFIAHFTIIFNVVKYAFLLSAIFFLQRFNPKWQVYSAIIGNTLTFTGLTLICTSNFLGPVAFYLGVLSLVLMASLFSALTEAGLLGILGQFPPQYTQVFVAGHGFAGVIVITINVISYFVAGSFKDPRFAVMYFGISTGILFTCFLLFAWLQRIKFFKHFEIIAEEVAEVRDLEVEENMKRLQTCSSIYEVYKKTKDYVWANFISTVIGFTVFPIFFFATHSTKCGTPAETWYHRDMFPQVALVFANIADFIGKFIPSIPGLEFKHGSHALFALSRIVIIPIYLFGNIRFDGYQLPIKPYLANDILFFTTVTLSSMSTSYLGTVCMMWAPSKVEPKDRGLAIALIILSNGAGFCFGSSISLGISELLIRNSVKL